MSASRRALVPLSALTMLLGAGCGRRDTEPCPGVPLAAMQLHGVLVSTDCLAPPADWPWAPQSVWNPLVPATLPPDPDPTDASVPTFGATWNSTGGDGVSYCSGGSRALPLLGTLEGTHVVVQRTLEDGTALPSCAASCRMDTTLVIEGELTGDPPAAFSGTLTEALGNPSGSCGACVIPCTSTYTLTGGT